MEKFTIMSRNSGTGIAIVSAFFLLLSVPAQLKASSLLNENFQNSGVWTVIQQMDHFPLVYFDLDLQLPLSLFPCAEYEQPEPFDLFQPGVPSPYSAAQWLNIYDDAQSLKEIICKYPSRVIPGATGGIYIPDECLGKATLSENCSAPSYDWTNDTGRWFPWVNYLTYTRRWGEPLYEYDSPYSLWISPVWGGDVTGTPQVINPSAIMMTVLMEVSWQGQTKEITIEPKDHVSSLSSDTYSDISSELEQYVGDLVRYDLGLPEGVEYELEITMVVIDFPGRLGAHDVFIDRNDIAEHCQIKHPSGAVGEDGISASGTVMQSDIMDVGLYCGPSGNLDLDDVDWQSKFGVFDFLTEQANAQWIDRSTFFVDIDSEFGFNMAENDANYYNWLDGTHRRQYQLIGNEAVRLVDSDATEEAFFTISFFTTHPTHTPDVVAGTQTTFCNTTTAHETSEWLGEYSEANAQDVTCGSVTRHRDLLFLLSDGTAILPEVMGSSQILPWGGSAHVLDWEGDDLYICRALGHMDQRTYADVAPDDTEPPEAISLRGEIQCRTQGEWNQAMAVDDCTAFNDPECHDLEFADLGGDDDLGGVAGESPIWDELDYYGDPSLTSAHFTLFLHGSSSGRSHCKRPQPWRKDIEDDSNHYSRMDVFDAFGGLKEGVENPLLRGVAEYSQDGKYTHNNDAYPDYLSECLEEAGPFPSQFASCDLIGTDADDTVAGRLKARVLPPPWNFPSDYWENRAWNYDPNDLWHYWDRFGWRTPSESLYHTQGQKDMSGDFIVLDLSEFNETVRFVGWDSWRRADADEHACDAQNQLLNAVLLYCTGQRSCDIYTHSTGGLVFAHFMQNNQDLLLGEQGGDINIYRIRHLASAAGGAEMARKRHYGGFKVGAKRRPMPLLPSLFPEQARAPANNWNDTAYLINETSSGMGRVGGNSSRNLTEHGVSSTESASYSRLYVAKNTLGKNDGVLSQHSLCSLVAYASFEELCPWGNQMAAGAKVLESNVWNTINLPRWNGWYTVQRDGRKTDHGTSIYDWHGFALCDWGAAGPPPRSAYSPIPLFTFPLTLPFFDYTNPCSGDPQDHSF